MWQATQVIGNWQVRFDYRKRAPHHRPWTVPINGHIFTLEDLAASKQLVYDPEKVSYIKGAAITMEKHIFYVYLDYGGHH
jgi:hypothetical protein